jgi:hypothetical protein
MPVSQNPGEPLNALHCELLTFLKLGTLAKMFTLLPACRSARSCEFSSSNFCSSSSSSRKVSVQRPVHVMRFVYAFAKHVERMLNSWLLRPFPTWAADIDVKAVFSSFRKKVKLLSNLDGCGQMAKRALVAIGCRRYVGSDRFRFACLSSSLSSSAMLFCLCRW